MKFQFDKTKALPHIIISAILLVISMVYFSPALQGYSLDGHDLKMHKGMSKEIVDYRNDIGGEPLWTNAMFGGMPAEQISVRYDSNLMNYVYNVYTFWLPRPVSYLWTILIGFYILLMCLKVDPWVGLVGALAFGFSSFFMISLQAGHMSKINAIGFMAPAIGGFILLFRGHLIKGGILATMFLSLQLWAGHPQITYYTFFIIGIVGLYYLANLLMDKQFNKFGKIAGISIAVVLLSVSTSLASLWSTYEYGKETIRGSSELTLKTPAQIAKEKEAQKDSTKIDKAGKVKDGLESDYILAWSYGTGETFTFMFPSLKGGGNDSPTEKSIGTLYPVSAEALTEKLTEDLASMQIDDALKQYVNLAELPAKSETGYYGQQGLTNGPVFIGAIMCFLCFLALIFSDGKYNYYLFGISLTIIVFVFLRVPPIDATIVSYVISPLLLACTGISIALSRKKPNKLLVNTLVILTLSTFFLKLSFILCLYFILLSFCVLNKRLIWFLFAILMLTVFLAWGKNYLDFSELFIQYFPMYKKFRSVTMILVVAELIIPLIAILFLYQVVLNKDKIKEQKLKFYIGSGLFVGFLLLVIASPDALFEIPKEPTRTAQYYEGQFNSILSQNNAPEQFSFELKEYFNKYATYMYDLRVSVIRKDAGLALLFVILSGGLIFLYIEGKAQKGVLLSGMGVLIMLEMIPVAQKYLHNGPDASGDYVYWAESDQETYPYPVFKADLQILDMEIAKKPWLKDTIDARVKLAKASEDGLDKEQENRLKMSILNRNTNFRVANFQGLTSETRTSYYYKSIGGYHGAKLMKVQEMFDFLNRIGGQKFIDMMNVEYMVQYDIPSENPNKKNPMGFQPNPSALGAAWIVDQGQSVESTDAEMTAMFQENEFNPAATVLFDSRYADLVGEVTPKAANATIENTSYLPNKLEYKFNSSNDEVVVFSEIYYEGGWQAYIDDQPVDHFRADYLLRGLRVPAGDHTIRFEFSRTSFSTGSTISLIASLLVLGLVIYFLYLTFFVEQKEEEVVDVPFQL
jgi:hypothetical protein